MTLLIRSRIDRFRSMMQREVRTSILSLKCQLQIPYRNFVARRTNKVCYSFKQ